MPSKDAVYFTAHYDKSGKLTEISSPKPLKFMGSDSETAVGYIERDGQIYTLPVTQKNYEQMMQKTISLFPERVLFPDELRLIKEKLKSSSSPSASNLSIQGSIDGAKLGKSAQISPQEHANLVSVDTRKLNGRRKSI